MAAAAPRDDLDARARQVRAGLHLRSRRCPHGQRPVARGGLGGRLRLVPACVSRTTTGWHFIPFDRDADYLHLPRRAAAHRRRPCVPRQPRHPGARRAPGGRPGRETAYGLARHKGELRRARASDSAAWPRCPARAGTCRRPATRGWDARSSRRARAPCRCSSSSVSSSWSTTQLDATRCSARACARGPRPTCCSPRAAGSASTRARRSTLTHSGAGVVAGRRAGLRGDRDRHGHAGRAAARLRRRTSSCRACLRCSTRGSWHGAPTSRTGELGRDRPAGRSLATFRR